MQKHCKKIISTLLLFVFSAFRISQKYLTCCLTESNKHDEEKYCLFDIETLKIVIILQMTVPTGIPIL